MNGWLIQRLRAYVAGIGTMLLSALILGGCATVDHRGTQPRSPDDGAVIIRVLPNVQSSSLYFKNWQALQVARLPGPGESKETKFSIGPRTEAASRSAIYAGSLPPGTYRFVRFSAMQCGAMCVSSTLTVNPHFSRFEVQTGRLTDLGTLVQTDPGDGTRTALLTHTTTDESTLTRDLINELVPDLAPMLQRPTLTWQWDTVPASMTQLHRQSIRNSWGFASPREGEDGAFLYGTANGVVVRWMPSVGRRAFDVGERVAMDAVLITPSGGWMAGGEFSVVKLSNDRGRTWTNLRGALPLGLVVDLISWRQDVLLTMLKGKDVLIYRAPVGSDQWQLLASHTMDINWFFDIQGVRPQSVLVGDRLVTTVPGRQISVLDLPTGQVELRKLPGAAQMFSASADGVLRCRCVATLKVDPYESRDLGVSWQESSASRFLLMPAFKDKTTGVAFKGGLFSPSKFAYTRDGGASWTETTEAPLYFHQLFYSHDGRKAYAASLAGSLWETDNDGESWHVVK